jgi:type II secretory pathway component PulF
MRKKKNTEKVFRDFVSELDLFLKNGYDILTSLELYRKSASDEETKTIFQEIINTIRAGEKFTHSLFQKDFSRLPSFYRMIFQSAEKSGTLPHAVSELCSFLHKKDSFSRDFTRILIYPVLTISIAVIALFIILFHFLPSLSSVYRDMDIPLPFLSRVLLGIGERLSLDPVVSLIMLMLPVGAFLFAARKYHILKRMKIFRSFREWLDCYSLSFDLYMLLSSGLDFLASLEILSENGAYGPQLEKITQNIRNGTPAETCFRKHLDLPENFHQALDLGMQRGRLDQSFRYLFQSAQAKLEHDASLFLTFLGPAMILITAVIVGIIVFVGLYPILTLSDAL